MVLSLCRNKTYCEAGQEGMSSPVPASGMWRVLETEQPSSCLAFNAITEKSLKKMPTDEETVKITEESFRGSFVMYMTYGS